MSIQHDGKGRIIIGEAALSLALGEKEISVQSLIAELEHMAQAGGSDNRLAEISEARSWPEDDDEDDHSSRAQACTGRRTSQGRHPPIVMCLNRHRD